MLAMAVNGLAASGQNLTQAAHCPPSGSEKLDAAGKSHNLLLTAKPHRRCERHEDGSSRANGEFAVFEFTMRPRLIAGPVGPLPIYNLPSPTAGYWVARRKTELLAAINGGLIGLADTCARYSLSGAELGLWRRALDRAGIPGSASRREDACVVR